MEDITKFLIINGFKKEENNKSISYLNDRCIIDIEDGIYCVTDNDANCMYSKDLNIYWLIGVLTYYGYIDKNYNQW